ncbi:hypothetical protein Ssi03_59340 [Sphaerisporangium siamense]|uniref:Uncharacterized protein n=1 Tax=Sphaerisporangium siamense TaxID=795645 RepID=A0A7W7D3Q8_9ACTN|nr:hypothetical protein [Sphaerisporangium siamense]MBB4699764.1 hypothetical protein [Sphaerisporangium siamense]GII87944.1 hypothetical protein Ssi03_59340 [Sphaerisporangium siamense]
MNDTKSTLSDRRLDRMLAGLDAAVTSPDLVTGSDAKARAVLRRVLSGAEDRTSVPGLTPSRPRRRVRVARRAAAFGAVAATVTVGFVAGPSLFRGGQALAWSATPHALSTGAARQAESACLKAVLDDPAPVEGADRSRMRPVITEARGSLVMVYLTDRAASPSESTCYVRDGSVVAMGGSLATPQSPPAPAVGPKSVLVNLGGVMSTSSGSIRGVTGRVGADVVGVVFDTVAKGPVTATVREGHVAVWWPDAPTTEQQENAATAPEIRGATLTLRDGSTRQVGVEDLSDRTTREPTRPASGGSE